MSTRKTYSRQFKVDTLQLVKTSGKPVSVIERELGLSQGLIHHWCTIRRMLITDSGAC